MSVVVFGELQVYTCIGLVQPECMQEHLLGMTANVIDRRRKVFNVDKVAMPYEDVGLYDFV